ncbi:MAG TPA: SURF1 family protein [Casimicrobiaceae bacterium]|nr:SURF1 family protein [Casimicrobiaceae bacterium]
MSESSTPVTSRRPAWIPFVAMIVFVAMCVTAANWQRRRMLEKDALRAALDAANRAPPVAVPSGADDWSAWRYRRVRAEGRYDASEQFLVDNRVHDGRVGYDVVTPLALRDGSWLLVDRGFAPAGRDRRDLPKAPPPSGDVTVEGRLDVAPSGFLFGNPEPDGVLWPHLDPARFAARTHRAVLPVYLQATGGAAGDSGLLRDWPEPDLGSERHLSYMVQWYTFAALAAGLWLYFTLRRKRAVR